MSIAGGYYKAIERGREAGCDCVQLFTKNNNQWRAKPISDEDVARFREALAHTGIEHTLSHASYLLNIASPNPELRRKSIDGLVIELQRATLLGVPYVVFHPGSYTTSTEEEGIARISEAIDEVHAQIDSDSSQMLLETVAGQGSNLGWQFEQLADMLGNIRDPERVGICVDTCHIFAAGYDLRELEQYQATFDAFDKAIGIDRIKAFHLNDSKAPHGSRKDRHEHIGDGCMGLEPFRFLLRDPRMQQIPMYVETEKGTHDETGEDLDEMNLRTLRSLV